MLGIAYLRKSSPEAGRNRGTATKSQRSVQDPRGPISIRAWYLYLAAFQQTRTSEMITAGNGYMW